MVTSEVRNKEAAPAYPYLGVHPSQMVVLFTTPKEGVVVHAPAGPWPVGSYKTIWGEEHFKRFSGEVVLSS